MLGVMQRLPCEHNAVCVKSLPPKSNSLFANQAAECINLTADKQ